MARAGAPDEVYDLVLHPAYRVQLPDGELRPDDPGVVALTFKGGRLASHGPVDDRSANRLFDLVTAGFDRWRMRHEAEMGQMEAQTRDAQAELDVLRKEQEALQRELDERREAGGEG